MLCFVTKGKGTLISNGASHSIEPFQLFYLTPGMIIEPAGHVREVEYYVIILEAVAASKQESRWKLERSAVPAAVFPSGRLDIRDAKQTLQRIEELYHSANNRSGFHLQDPDLLLQALIDFIKRDQLNGGADRASDNGIDSCIAYMHRHFHDKITRDTLAEIAKLTPNAFCRSFKRATGASPTDYLNRIRINHAKEQLTPGSSVKEVAAAAGYGSEYYFSRIFKETVGLSPTLFIKRERLKVAAASRTCFHDNLASIGMNTAAAVDCYRYPWMDEADYDRRLSSQLEQLRLVKPDLIIGDFFHQSLNDSLKQIAPTIILEHHLDWRVTHMRIAELVGREKEAVQTFHQLDERTSEARERISLSIGNVKITVMQVIQDAVRIQGAVNHPLNELLYSGLGLKPGNAVPLNKMREEWPPEEFPFMESDYLFIIKTGSQPKTEAALSKLQQTYNWESVHATLKPNTYFIPNWLLMSWTPQGRDRIIKEIVDTVTR
jgi:AraC-like DNA-binding protein